MLEEGATGFVGSGKSDSELEIASVSATILGFLSTLIFAYLLIVSALLILSPVNVSIMMMLQETRRSTTRVAASGMSHAFVLDLLSIGES